MRSEFSKHVTQKCIALGGSPASALHLHSLSWSPAALSVPSHLLLSLGFPLFPITVAWRPGFGKETRSWAQWAKRALSRTLGAVPAPNRWAKVQS